jgi:hypothetical protein
MIAHSATGTPIHCSCGKCIFNPFPVMLRCSKACTNEGFTMFSLISLFLAARREVTLPATAPRAAADAQVELRLAA